MTDELHFGDRVKFTCGFYQGHEGIVFEKRVSFNTIGIVSYYRIYVKHELPDVPSSVVEVADIEGIVKVNP